MTSEGRIRNVTCAQSLFGYEQNGFDDSFDELVEPIEFEPEFTAQKPLLPKSLERACFRRLRGLQRAAPASVVPAGMPPTLSTEPNALTVAVVPTPPTVADAVSLKIASKRRIRNVTCAQALFGYEQNGFDDSFDELVEPIEFEPEFTAQKPLLPKSIERACFRRLGGLQRAAPASVAPAGMPPTLSTEPNALKVVVVPTPPTLADAVSLTESMPPMMAGNTAWALRQHHRQTALSSHGAAVAMTSPPKSLPPTPNTMRAGMFGKAEVCVPRPPTFAMPSSRRPPRAFRNGGVNCDGTARLSMGSSGSVVTCGTN